LDQVAARKREMFLPIPYVQRALTDLHEHFFCFGNFSTVPPLFVFAANTVRLPACETVPRITGTFSIWFGDRLLT
jgi:hypothetical protein